MLKKIKAMWGITAEAKSQGVTMQRRLILYWISMVLAAFAALMLILSFTGVFSDPAKKLASTLAIQQTNAASALQEQMNTLMAQCVLFSESVSQQLQDTLVENSVDLEDLNNNPEMIAEVESALYAPVYTTLRVSDCSGAFVLLNATVNTGVENAAHSRMGLYLRYSDLNSTSSASQHLAFFRGVSEVARREKVQMHNRWNLEFDTTQIPGYDDLMGGSVVRLADSCLWSERLHLKDTWEDALLVYVPILDSNDEVCGLCGVEISELYFRLSHSIVESNYGNMVTILSPLEGDQLVLDRAMLGASGGTRLEAEGTLTIKEGTLFNTYSNGTERYIGQHQIIDDTSASGTPLAVVTLIPESSYIAAAAASRNVWIITFLILLLCTLAMAVVLSHLFVKPIIQSLKAIQNEQTENPRSGISEVDELMRFLQSKAMERDALKTSDLPPNIEQLLRTFRANVSELTPAERNLLQYYVDGQSLEDAAAQSFTSVNTMRKHNTNLRRKLEIGSQEELMLYIDLFRRCDRLAEITVSQAPRKPEA